MQKKRSLSSFYLFRSFDCRCRRHGCCTSERRERKFCTLFMCFMWTVVIVRKRARATRRRCYFAVCACFGRSSAMQKTVSSDAANFAPWTPPLRPPLPPLSSPLLLLPPVKSPCARQTADLIYAPTVVAIFAKRPTFCHVAAKLNARAPPPPLSACCARRRVLMASADWRRAVVRRHAAGELRRETAAASRAQSPIARVVVAEISPTLAGARTLSSSAH